MIAVEHRAHRSSSSSSSYLYLVPDLWPGVWFFPSTRFSRPSCWFFARTFQIPGKLFPPQNRKNTNWVIERSFKPDSVLIIWIMGSHAKTPMKPEFTGCFFNKVLAKSGSSPYWQARAVLLCARFYAARLPRARKNTTNGKWAERRGPWLGATSDLIMPRATCAELMALCCAVCLLAMARSDRQYESNLRKKKAWRGPRGQSTKEAKGRARSSTHVHTAIYATKWRLSALCFVCCSVLVINARRQHATNAVALRAAGGRVFIAIWAEGHRCKMNAYNMRHQLRISFFWPGWYQVFRM